MMSRTITRIAIALSAVILAPALLASGPEDAPPLGTERFIVYFSCSTGSPVYVGHEEWDCEGDYYSQGNTNASRVRVSDTDCDTWVGEQRNWCRTPTGNWYQISEAWFNSCHICPDIGN